MPAAIKLSQAMQDRAVTLYRDGHTLQEVAVRLGVSHPVIQRILKERGVKTRTKGPRTLTPQQEAEVVVRWHEGWTMKAIAADFECSVEPIIRLLTEAGIERRDHRPDKRLSADRHAEVIEIYESSVSVTCHGLGKRLGTHGNEIRRILLLHGITPRDGRVRKGSDNPNYKNGQWVGPDGYVRILVEDDDPMVAVRIPSGRYALEHRLIMARHLGRPPTKAERVHHKNGVKDDNRIENLELWSYHHPPGQRVADKPPHCPTCTCGQ